MTSHDTITPPPAHELPEAASEAAQVTLETGQPTEAPAEARTEVPAPARAYVSVKPKVKASHGVPRLLAYPYRTTPERADSVAVAADSIPTDSVAAHTTAVIEGEHMQGIVLINPAAAYRDAEPAPEPAGWGAGMSWIYLGIAVLFCIVGLKFKGSKRYLKALMTDLTDTRTRHNAFDDTVKETSLLVLLNVMWVASAGILLWVCVALTTHISPGDSGRVMPQPARGIAICMAVAAAYLVLMLLAYWIVGSVFSDRKLTRLWLKGASASMGLQTFMLFPLSLVALNYPKWDVPVLLIAAGVFVIGKIVFLYKGFRIFFTQISSWLLFLYYLCSLEIVPLILTYLGAVTLCTVAY